MTAQAPLHLMLDLETWSTRPHATIISIGACFFDPNAAEPGVGEKFYVAINPAEPLHSVHVDPETIMWWMSPERREALDAWLAESKVSMFDGLFGLSEWVREVAGDAPVCLWGNGAAFDNVLLATAFRVAGIEPFWTFWNDLCYRTIKRLAPDIKILRTGTYHNALDDAVSQALHLQAILRKLELRV